MVAAIETPFGNSLPPFSRHAITIHAPGWSVLNQLVGGSPEFVARIKATYPRFGPSLLTKALIDKVSATLGDGKTCFLFPNQDAAWACKAFICSPDRGVNSHDVSVKAFDFHVRIYATVFPVDQSKTAISFWKDTGTAISTRLAEDCLGYGEFKEATLDSEPPATPTTTAYETLQTRIVELLERAPSSKHSTRVGVDDVYLYQTGMASIYLPHLYLSATRPGTTILYGFAFHCTPHVFERYGNTSFKWFSRGGDLELGILESFVESEHTAGRRIQALWAEYPTNPNLTVPNLKSLRAIADKYAFPIIIDDTLASFANVDVMGDSGADAVMTSLTKAFSGYADAMGGSFVLNPCTKHYDEFKHAFKDYTNDLYAADAEVLEKNSRDFLRRTAILNRNALALASYFSRPELAHLIERVYYPTEFKANYDANLRTPSEFVPGYGCLLSIEFRTIQHMIAFYEHVPTHCGPHLGAHRTLTLPYPKLLIIVGNTDDIVVNKGGMSERIIRISVGLEDEEELVQAFKQGIEQAEEIVRRGTQQAGEAEARKETKEVSNDADGLALAERQ